MRSRHRDVLRLGRGARLRRAGLQTELHALRTLPGILESRLHGIRAPCRRQADTPTDAERRHGHGGRADGGDPAGRHDGLRDRRVPGDHALDRRAKRRRVRRFPRGDEGTPRARGSRPWDDVSRRRRHRAVERGPRLCHAPDHSARSAAGSPCRARGALPRAALGRRDRADEAGLSGARGTPRGDPPHPDGGGGTLREDTRARAAPLRGSCTNRRGHLRRGRVPATRHVRLSTRADQ